MLLGRFKDAKNAPIRHPTAAAAGEQILGFGAYDRIVFCVGVIRTVVVGIVRLFFAAIRKREGFSTSICKHWLNQARIQLESQFTQDGFAQLERSLDLDELLAFDFEVRQPVSTFLVLIDRVGESLFHPHPANEHVAFVFGDDLFDLLADAAWIASVLVAIEDE